MNNNKLILHNEMTFDIVHVVMTSMGISKLPAFKNVLKFISPYPILHDENDIRYSACCNDKYKHFITRCLKMF